LTRLGANNAHHKFEHLCRNLAKSKVVTNVISSTGPVSSLGDQGIDFRSYKVFFDTKKEDHPEF